MFIVQTHMERIQVDSDRLFVIVKPNSRKTEILSWDGKEMKVAVSEPAENNKANIALIKFLSKKLGKIVRITSGLTSKKKLLLIS